MQSALRSTPSFPRWSSRAFTVIVAALALVSFAGAQAPTVTTLTTAAAPGGTRGAITLTAQVSAAGSPATDAAAMEGSVTFQDRGSDGLVRELGSAPLNPAGIATLHLSSLPGGTHNLRAVFNGTEEAASSSSASTQMTAEATTPPDFSLTANPTSLNLQAGAQGTVTVTISPVNGFSNYVSLSCAGLPLFTTCSFLPSNVNVSTVAAQSTFALNTVAPSGKAASLTHDSGLFYAFLLPGAVGLAGLGLARNRRLRMLALLCVAGSLITGASSCAQRYTYLHHGPTPNPGTPNGQSVIRIFGTSVNGADAQVKCVQLTLNVTSTNTESGTNILTPCPAS